MGRWTQYDEDDYRLPEGMKRVGYDADTQKYYFRDQDGTLWEGPEGAQYGELARVTHASASAVLDDHSDADEDVEAAPSRADGYQALAEDPNQPHIRPDNSGAYRRLFPFALMMIVVLLLVIRLTRPSTHTEDPVVTMCSSYTHAYRIKSGDTCWDIAQSHGFTVQDLQDVNPKLDCDALTPTEIICLPKEKPS